MKAIIIVPCNSKNGIDQESPVDEILNCKEHEQYTTGQFCQMCNDEVIDIECNWVFYVDLENKLHLNTI